MNEPDTNNELLETGESPLVSETAVFKPGLSPRMPVGRQLSILAALLIGIFSIGSVSFWLTRDGRSPLEQSAAVGQSAGTFDQTDRDQSLRFDELTLAARAAIVVDARDGQVLYEAAADDILPLASITKLMTALVASEIVEEGAAVTINETALNQNGDSGFALGERFSHRSLSDLMLLTSSNDGAYALSAAVGAALDPAAPDTAFVKAMNVRAKELGLVSTYFRNPTGLDISETEAGAYGTAREVAVLMNYILRERPELLEATAKSSRIVRNQSGGEYDAENTNRIIDAIPLAIASKTGYTTLSGGNLAVAFEVGINHPVIAVVLGSTHQGRFSDMVALVEAARNQLRSEQ